MKNKNNNKQIFFCGLGEQPSAYKFLSKYLNVIPIDWNNIKLPKFKVHTAVGFSMGAILACEYARKKKVKNLILCSITTGVETLSKVRADNIIFMVGEKEKWVIKDINRVRKTLKCKNQVIIVSGANHKIMGQYQKQLLGVVCKIKDKTQL